MTKISNIKKFREARDWSQERLGAELGVNQATISRWENGSDTPKASILLALEHLSQVYPASDGGDPASPAATASLADEASE